MLTQESGKSGKKIEPICYLPQATIAIHIAPRQVLDAEKHMLYIHLDDVVFFNPSPVGYELPDR